MKDIPLAGSLAEILLPQVLFLIWQKEGSGELCLERGNTKKLLYFKEGNVAVELDSFPEKEFLKALVKKKIIPSDQAEKCENFAAENKTSLTKALTELSLLPPLRLWNLIEAFFKLNLFPLFDWAQGEYILDSGALPREERLIGLIQTLDFILQGLRRMRNFSLIENSLPAENETIQISFPHYFHLLNLETHEKYFLSILQNSQALKNIYESSELGKKESQKILFSFFILGLARPSGKETKTKPTSDFTSAEPLKILDAFNEKCAYIFKYISKELGPVGLNVIAKCLEEAKPCLGPLFQKIELAADGRISWDSSLIANLSLSAEGNFKNFLRSLDEILTAEVLAVKRTLGNDHEAILVKNLEKIGSL